MSRLQVVPSACWVRQSSCASVRAHPGVTSDCAVVRSIACGVHVIKLGWIRQISWSGVKWDKARSVQSSKGGGDVLRFVFGRVLHIVSHGLKMPKTLSKYFYSFNRLNTV